MKKYLLKDLYVAYIYKVFDIKKFDNVSIFYDRGRCQSIGDSLKIVQLDRAKKNVVDCITGTKYPILENMTFYDLYINQLICHKEKLVPFYEFYPDFAPYFIKKGRDPQKVKVSQKFLLLVKNNLDKKSEDLQQTNQSKNDNEQTF